MSSKKKFGMYSTELKEKTELCPTHAVYFFPSKGCTVCRTAPDSDPKR